MLKYYFYAVKVGLFFIIISSCQPTKSTTASRVLKFNFEKGKGYDYEMEMKIDQEIMGQQIKMDMSSYYTMDVVGAEGDVKTVSTMFDRIKMDMDMPGSSLSFDSDKRGVDPGSVTAGPMDKINNVFGGLVNRKFTMKINAEGKVEQVSGFKEMVAAMMDSMNLQGDDRTEAMARFNQQFNEDGMKSQFERVLYIFPNKEVKVGDSWEKGTTVTGQMGGQYASTYTVKEIEGDIVTLNEQTKIQGQQADMEMTGTVTGTINVDSKSGLVVNADQDIIFNISKAGQKFDMKAKNKIKGKAR